MRAVEIKQDVVWDWMREEVEVIQWDAPLKDAVAQMDHRRIHHLVVLNEQEFVGVLDARDCAGIWNAELPVHKVMRKNVPTIDNKTEVSGAIDLIVTHRLTALPILCSGRVTGIVTSTDLLQLLAEQIKRDYALSHVVEKGMSILAKPVVQTLTHFCSNIGI